MPKKYEVRTSSGLPVFEGNHKKCEEYIAQALQKGSQPGFLSIHPKYTHYNDLPEELRSSVFTELQWAKKGYFPNDDESGMILWTNHGHVEKKRYLNQEQVHPGTAEELENYAAANTKRVEAKHRLVVLGLKSQIARLEQDVDCMEKREAKCNKRLDSVIDAYQGLLRDQCKREGSIRGTDLPARIVLDTETTGLDSRRDELVQIAILNADTGEAVLSTYVRPVWTLEWPEAQRIHGITPEMVADAPTLAELHLTLRAIFGTARQIIGYNTFFDLSFLEPYGIIPWGEIADVMMDFAPIYGEWSEYHGDYKWQSLATCAAYYGYEWGEGKAHDSLADCQATLFCYKRIEAEQALKEDL